MKKLDTGNYRWSCVCLFWIVSQVIAAQNNAVTIKINDQETGEPLSLATVSIHPGDIGGVSTVDGIFTLPLSDGIYELTVNFLGYEEHISRMTISRDTTIQINMNRAITGLQTVEVTAKDISDHLERPLMSVQRLTQKQIDELPVVMGERDILKGLQLLPGVSSAGEASNGISVRGGTLDQNLVLLDHAPIFNPTHLFGLFSIFPSEGLRSADLYQGNIPSRYGGRIASVLDVRMKNPSSRSTRLHGGVGLAASHLFIETPVIQDQLYLMGSLRAGFNDFWFDLVPRLKDTRANFSDALVKLSWRPGNRHLVHLTGFYSRDFYQVDLINQFAGIVSHQNIYDYETLNGTIEWQYILNPRTYWQNIFVRADYNPRIRLPEAGTDHEAIFASNIRNDAFHSLLHHRVDSRLNITGGISINKYYNAPGSLDPGSTSLVNAVNLPDERGYEGAIFTETDWNITDRLALSAGVRYSGFFLTGPREKRIYSSPGYPTDDEVTETETFGRGSTGKYYGGLEPRLGFRWSPGDRVSIKAAYALNRQYLQNIFNSTTPLPTSRWKLTDEYIRPQFSHLVSTGIYWQSGLQYEMGIESYFRTTRNLLEYKPGAEFFLKKFVETEILQGDGLTYGWEFSLQKTAGQTSGWLNYSYARAFNKIQGPDFTNRINSGDWYPGNFDRPHTINAVYILQGGEHHSLSLNFTYSSGRPYSIPNGHVEIDDTFIPIFLERNNGRIRSYHRLDFSWKIMNPGMEKRRWVGEWIFTVYNLYGRKNAYNIYYGPRSGGFGNIFGSSRLGAYQISIFAAPIVSLTYQFKFS